MCELNVKEFDCFNVYYSNDAHSFVYAQFISNEQFIQGLIEYIFREDNLLNYAKRKNRINFIGSQIQYTKLYNNISLFLNTELEQLMVDEVSDEVKSVLGEEYHLIDDQGNLIVQKDKIGKIGEYAFHLLMTRFFGLDCILPKFRCSTDRNMSVFGIDTLFLDTVKKIIYFGEAKLCKDIKNGIVLVNRSLKDYEQQIQEEYRIVLSNDDAFKLSSEFEDIFGEERQMCISFSALIEKAHIDTIGVPIFIAHGNTLTGINTPEEYINKLTKSIKRESFFGLNTQYLFISLPILDKNRFIEAAIKKAMSKQHEYEQRSRGNI